MAFTLSSVPSVHSKGCLLVRRDHPDWPQPTTPTVSALMEANTGSTSPERAVRSALHRRGLRFRKRNTIRLAGRRWTRPDVTFPRERLVLYVDGCFWHRCPEHGTEPRSNSAYWGPKLDRNVARDRDTEIQLEQQGWLVLRAWEHEDLGAIADRVEAALLARRSEA
jgi:DNA mismatch endonuclease (patch repair protein)